MILYSHLDLKLWFRNIYNTFTSWSEFQKARIHRLFGENTLLNQGFGFGLPRSVIGRENSHRHLNESDAKITLIYSWLSHSRFPVFPVDCLNLHRVLIG